MKIAYFADSIYYDSQIINDAWLLVENDKIQGITRSRSEINEYKEVVYKNSAIFPGLINTHTHLGMSLFRGMADDMPLMKWLSEYIWPAEKKEVSFEFVYNATILSLAESIHSGVTCINEMYFHADATTKALHEANLKGIVGFGVFSIEKSFKEIDAFQETELVKASICPHALYTVPFEIFKKCAEVAGRKNILLHTHLSETKNEVEEIKSKYNRTPVELMNETGAFDVPSIFAHCVHLNDNDIKILSDKKVAVSHCIESNLKLASGFAPVTKLMESGALLSIGTDGAASNNDQSMIGEIATVSKVHKALESDATAMSAETVLNMATKNAAKSLRLNDVGELKQGFKADFFVLSFDSVHMTPVYHPVSHLVYTAQPSDVTDVVVNGKIVMQNRKILTFDEEKVKTTARKIAKSR